MAKIIKEIIIMLLVCLISMLILAITLYDYIPNRKVVAEITDYNTSEEIEVQLADDIDSEKKEVVLTYEVTSSDLNTFERKNEYVPGKDNPFSEATDYISEEDDDDTDDTSIENDSEEEEDSSTSDEGIK